MAYHADWKYDAPSSPAQFDAEQPTIREKVITWLRLEAVRTGLIEVIVPFSRGELADFLGVDRSALSRELGRMADEGLIRCEGKVFTLCPAKA